MDSRDFDFDLFFHFAPRGYLAPPIQIHIATAGGNIPQSVYSRSSHSEERRFLKSFPDRREYELNPNINEILLTKEEMWLAENDGAARIDYQLDRHTYLQDFIEYAGCGCFSFDRTNVNDSDDERYHLVAYPRLEREFVTRSPNPGYVLDVHEYVRRNFSNPVHFSFDGRLLVVRSERGEHLGVGI